MGGIFGADLFRDETAGPDHITIYHRRDGCPIYLSCPECGQTNHLDEIFVEEVREFGHTQVECPSCPYDAWKVTEEDFEYRAYTRLGEVEIPWGK